MQRKDGPIWVNQIDFFEGEQLIYHPGDESARESRGSTFHAHLNLRHWLVQEDATCLSSVDGQHFLEQG